MTQNFCGVWGHLREEYLRTNKPRLYNVLLEKDELEEYLTGYQTAYSDRADKMAKKLAEERGVNETLYETDSLQWILETEKIQEEVKSMLRREIQQ